MFHFPSPCRCAAIKESLSKYSQCLIIPSCRQWRIPNHSRRSRFSEIAALYFLPFLKCTEICSTVHSLLLVRSRSRIAASWSLGSLGNVFCSVGIMMASSTSVTPSNVCWVRTSSGAWYSGRSQRIYPFRSSSARWAFRATNLSKIISSISGLVLIQEHH